MTAGAAPSFELRLLGPIELWANGERLALPRSKKTRALLAYLAMSGRAHRRERLCDLLWDITDDPRGGLRWSLSRLRKAIEWDRARVEATREEVRLDVDGLVIDAVELGTCVREGLANADTEALDRVAEMSRGSFVEGLELSDALNFDAWCIAQREQLREAHSAVLGELVTRMKGEPERALPFARKRAEVDSLDVQAQIELLRLLVTSGKYEEAEARYEGGERLFGDLGAAGLGELRAAWRELYMLRKSAVATPKRATPPAPPAASPTQRTPATWPFVGRAEELSRLEEELDEIANAGKPRVMLLQGEPGAGKSRLAERWLTQATNAGFAVFSSRAYEAESTRPYGPWVDALELNLTELLTAVEGEGASREALFQAALDTLAKRATGRGVVVILDDLQWLDRDSVELLHFIVRKYRGGPLLVVLLARVGELADNEAASRAVRRMERDLVLTSLELAPLSKEEVAGLLVEHKGADPEAIFRASAGNPLYAIELARARELDGSDTPASLIALVRDRVDLLPSHAIDVLRWGAVLGHAMGVERLEALCSLDLDRLIDALEVLEHHALLGIDAARSSSRYVFGHDIVREAVYSDLSQPRRRLMHRKVVELLAPKASEASIATEIAHHAGLAGEALPGVEACLVAGRQSLRVFADSDAYMLARRGLRLAESLEESERLTATLELLHLQYSARVPDRAEAANEVRPLAERALDLGLTHAARLGFQMLSFLRWESSSMAAAHDNIMQAERVSRAAEPPERCMALAQAAKCLVLLERNLNQAEAFVMEATGLTARGVAPKGAVAFANGMLEAYRGEYEAAVDSYRRASELSREHGERLTEFAALEHWTMLELDRGNPERALELAEPLVDLGARVRPGAEGPSGRALFALARLACGDLDSREAVASAIEELRTVDAKYQLAYVLTRLAGHWVTQGDFGEAQRLGDDALAVATAINRHSEIAFAHAILARCAAATGDEASRAHHAGALADLDGKELSFACKMLRDFERMRANV